MDQAQGLRDLIAGKERYAGESAELRVRLKDLAEGIDHAATLPIASEPGLDKAKLWEKWAREAVKRLRAVYSADQRLGTDKNSETRMMLALDDAQEFLTRFDNETLATVRGAKTEGI